MVSAAVSRRNGMPAAAIAPAYSSMAPNASSPTSSPPVLSTSWTPVSASTSPQAR